MLHHATIRVVILILSLSVVLAGSIRPGLAVDGASLQLGSVAGAGWSAQQVSVQLDWTQPLAAGLVLQAASLDLPAPLGRWRELRLSCPGLRYDGQVAECPSGRLQAISARHGRQQLDIAFRYQLSTQSLVLAIDRLQYAGGTVTVRVHYSAQQWSARIKAGQLQFAALERQLHELGYPVPALDGDGRISLQADVTGLASRLVSVSADLQINDATFTNADGSIAGEHARLHAHVEAMPRGPDWQIGLRVAAQGGAFYLDPVYLEVSGPAVQLDTRFRWQAQRRALQIQSLHYVHPDVLDVQASGRLLVHDTPRLDELQLELQQGKLPALYTTYLQPWLTQTAAGTLNTGGQIRGTLQVSGGMPQAASLQLADIDIEQRDELFGFAQLNGRLEWSAQDARRSVLSWQSGHVYRIALGESELLLDSAGRRVSLAQPAHIPVLDGALDIDSFALQQTPGQALRWTVDGILAPVSMQDLTRALHWPEFGGKLSGVIPQVSYDDGALSVGGVLLVRVFDGEITLRDLQLEQPLGQVPRLQVDANVRQIDLEQLTRTFSFGRIEGRLDGHVNGLQMESWEPVAFDAAFATPPDDRSRHRISQKAVDTISNIGGGGVGGALSRSFLRFLEEFPYDRIGISCRLQDGTCAMGGVEPATSGYYLVKGRFIPPRLDVIGYASRVNWNSLVQQLKQATRGNAPVVH